ncbi:MAG: hypothetical protein ABSG49_04485 [Methanoregula sp.]|jgi:hypothetical protein|uniref:hypothetical protein n=1 Tax=Methanoregula sp. TaxID=2052170 RepID=UPI003C19F695
MTLPLQTPSLPRRPRSRDILPRSGSTPPGGIHRQVLLSRFVPEVPERRRSFPNQNATSVYRNIFRENIKRLYLPRSLIQIKKFMTRKKRNVNFRDKCSSMIAPHFEILYKVADKLSTRYGIILPIEFWIASTFTIYALYMHFYGYSDTELLFFGSLAILSFLFANSSLIFNVIKKIKESIPETTIFLSDIENKEIKEVQKFLRDYRELSSKEIIILLKSKFSSFPSIHLSILKYQKISGEILEYIITNSIDHDMDSEILRKYIYSVSDDVSKSTVDQIRFRYKNKEITKTLFVSFPSHFRKVPVYSFLSKLRITICDWFNYGSGNGIIALPAFLLAIYSVLNYYTPILLNAAAKFDFIAIIINLANALMGLFIITGIIVIVVKIVILAILRFYKWILYLIAPSTISL